MTTTAQRLFFYELGESGPTAEQITETLAGYKIIGAVRNRDGYARLDLTLRAPGRPNCILRIEHDYDGAVVDLVADVGEA